MMTERLHRVLARIEQLAPLLQDEAAEQLEDWVDFFDEFSADKLLEKQYQSLAGAWAALPDADVLIDALDHLRHEAAPTPPLDAAEL